jgi:KDO2-lipid IV(A) lauroyltransferase
MLKKFSEHLTQGSLSTALAINLSQAFPSYIGYPAAKVIASALSNRFLSPIVKAVHLNQWVAHDQKPGHRELIRLVNQVFLNQARALYTFYHYLDRPEHLKKLVRVTEKMQYLIDTANRGKQGTLMLIPHLSGFDIGGLLLARTSFKYLTLSYPNPPHGYEWQNQIRNERGEEVMPMSFQSTQFARERLQAGGTVLTGIDRPYPGTGYFPQFFGRPADLPVAYVKLALRARARVFVVAFQTLADHTYEIDASDQIDLQLQSDPRQEIIDNAGRILAVAETFIRRNPATWAMFYPVWPELAKAVP